MFSKLLVLHALASTATVSALVARQYDDFSRNACKLLPGDRAWPSVAEWASLNKTINGRLIASVPEANVCHNSPFNNYNAERCSYLQDTWNETTVTNLGSPPDVLSQTFQNYSCVPYTPRSRPCELGNYATYVVNVKEAADVQAGLAFAQKHNIRLVIKNTGHDYLGKSTGKGSLSLWTHNLKSTQYIPNYKSAGYQGAAAKFGAGIEGFEALALANSTGHRVVGGTCPTVGIAGGYSLGGGHSLLSSSYGMGSDNVLEWEVVTVDGKHVVATPEQNTDLYWALTGGGGGTFGVVLSMTARLHPGGIVGGTILSFNDSGISNDAYWDAVGAFHARLPDFLDGGNSFTYAIGNTSLTAYGTMPDADAGRVAKLLQPFLDDLKKRGIPHSNTPAVSPNYADHFYQYLGPAPRGRALMYPFSNSRIVPRALVTDPARNRIVTQMLRNVSNVPAFAPFYCDSFSVARQRRPANSVSPAWRDGLFICSPAGAWDWTVPPAEMAARGAYAANVLQPLMDAATPGGGTYLSEASHLYADWKRQFYGSYYDRLLAIKKKYDPQSFLYARTAVGSDAWKEQPDGRICRA